MIDERNSARWRRVAPICLAAVLLLALSGCSRSPDAMPDQQPIKLALNWFPDAQHGGFYAARHFGFYEDEGLSVEIRPGGPATPVVQNVALERVDFGVGNADQILMARQQEAPVIALTTAMQNSPRCIMVHRRSGIKRLDQLGDVTLALGAGKAFARFMEHQGLLPDARVVPYTGGIAPFLADPKFAQQAYVFSEPFIAREKGADPHCLMVSELGFNPYTSCLFTHERHVAENPAMVAKMVRATRRGWREYLRNPDPINQLIHQDNPEMDLKSLKYAATSIKALCLTDEVGEADLGTMTDQRWATLHNQLVELGLIDRSQDLKGAYTLRFLQEELE